MSARIRQLEDALAVSHSITLSDTHGWTKRCRERRSLVPSLCERGTRAVRLARCTRQSPISEDTGLTVCPEAAISKLSSGNYRCHDRHPSKIQLGASLLGESACMA